MKDKLPVPPPRAFSVKRRHVRTPAVVEPAKQPPKTIAVRVKDAGPAPLAPAADPYHEPPLRACLLCGGAFNGRRGAKYCSAACRVKAHRARKGKTAAEIEYERRHPSADTLAERKRCAAIAREWVGDHEDQGSAVARKIAEEIERGE